MMNNEKKKQANRRSHSKHKKKRNSECQKFYLEHRDSKIKEARMRNLKRNYNLTPEDVSEMRRVQNNCCQICKKEFIKTPNIDHNHTTGKVRSLLCSGCNIGLGYYEINKEKYSSYLAEWEEKQYADEQI